MNIVVIGGGTAGWLTALYAKKVNEEHNVVLVESEDYGILGAGEGGTPQLIHILDFLEIKVEELIANCSSTIKNGIKFTNWSQDKSFFYHPFGSIAKESNDYNFLYNKNYEFDTSFSHIYASTNNHSTKDYVFIEKLSELGKVPFLEKNTNIEELAGWSIHFDAKKLANYLRAVAEKRGVIRKEGIVEELKNNLDGNIVCIRTNKEEILVDFVFDCSGFRRLVIGKHYQQKWKSYSSYLPAKKAIPFFLNPSDKIPPYTESIAMKYGWMWKIPLQHRYGCGYVYDSDYIEEDKAKEEIDKFLGYEVESPKTFIFDPGCYENVWVNNSLALGLSGSFLEPLEATSLWQTINTLQKFFSTNDNLYTKNKKIKDKFNYLYLQENQEYVDLIYTHYVTDRKDTAFWKDFTKNNKAPEFVEYLLSVIKDRPLSDFDFSERKLYSFVNYFYVLIGNNIITKDMLKNYKSKIYNKNKTYMDIVSAQNITINNLMGHDSYIESVKLLHEKN